MQGENSGTSLRVSLALVIILGILIALEIGGLTSSVNRAVFGKLGRDDSTTVRMLSLSASIPAVLAAYLVILLVCRGGRLGEIASSYLAFLVSLVLTMLAVLVLKISVQYPRPLEEELRLPLLQALTHYDYFSFPSGHVARASVLAYYAGRDRGVKAKAAAWLWVMGVGLSRMLLQRHWLSDVAASMVLGALISMSIDHARGYWMKINSRATGRAEVPRIDPSS